MNKQASGFPFFDSESLETQAANIGNDFQTGLNAMLRLGNHYASVGEFSQAIEWWGKLCEQGEPTGYLSIGRYYAWRCTETKECIEKEKFLDSVLVALRPVTRLDMPFPEASLHLGLAHVNVAKSYLASGWSTDEERLHRAQHLYMEAAEHFERAAWMPCSGNDLSPAIAGNALAHLHLQNIVGDAVAVAGMETNEQIAFGLFHRASKAGFGEAMYNLAVLYFHGIGTKASIQGADKWLLDAVNTIPENYPPRPGFKYAARKELVWLRSLSTGQEPSRPRAAFSPKNLRFSDCTVSGN